MLSLIPPKTKSVTSQLIIFRDEETEDGNVQSQMKNSEVLNVGGNPFLEVPSSVNAVEYKKGYVMRKCCYEANAKRSESYSFSATKLLVFRSENFH